MKKRVFEFFKVCAVALVVLMLANSVALFAQNGTPFNNGRGTFRGDVFAVLPFHLYQDVFATTTNCGVVGTAASPSVAACGAAASGSFSCATNATGATCVVNTTAVTANSQIDIIEDDSIGTRLSVTCNTGTAVLPANHVIASKVAGTSFTINLGTVTTNPACFDYTIVN